MPGGVDPSPFFGRGRSAFVLLQYPFSTIRTSFSTDDPPPQPATRSPSPDKSRSLRLESSSQTHSSSSSFVFPADPRFDAATPSLLGVFLLCKGLLQGQREYL
mgnify:FL=1